jgi:hypothetical protein
MSAQFEPFRHRLYDSNSTVSRVDLLPCSEYANSLQGTHIAANGFGIALEFSGQSGNRKRLCPRNFTQADTLLGRCLMRLRCVGRAMKFVQ